MQNVAKMGISLWITCGQEWDKLDTLGSHMNSRRLPLDRVADHPKAVFGWFSRVFTEDSPWKYEEYVDCTWVPVPRKWTLRLISCIYRGHMPRLTLKNVLSFLVVAGFIGGIFYYAYFQARAIISGPQISVISPENGHTYTDPLVHVYGTTKRAKEITLDGREIFIDLEGNFGEKLLLAPGYNIIELAARDADGHSTKETLEIIYKEGGSRGGVSSSTRYSPSLTPSATGSKPVNN